MRRAVVIVLLAGATAWFLWQRAPDPRLRQGFGGQAGPRLNVVLITIDTLRADRVGRGLTPSIDRLAARGATFPNVRATAPLTLPSHVSLMTGTIPPVHGVRENGVIFDRKTPTLARIFKDAGYRTGAFVGAYVLNRRFGLDEGFETYDDSVRRDASRAEQLEAERPGGEVVDAALTWLQPSASSNQPSTFNAQPFFLWVHLFDPHAPYKPPPEFLDRAGGHPYDGEVAYVDAQVGRLLDALDAGGLLDATIVALTGDHGEGLGEHGEQTHGMLVYDATLRVPVIIAAPGFERSSDEPCHWELGPGLLRMAGLSDRIPAGMASRYVMRPAASSGVISSDCAAYSESRYPRRAGWHALTATADAQWKLIASSEHELYNLRNDPGETRNVAADHPNVVQAMVAMLSKMQPRDEAPSVVAPEAAERLRALGYVGGSRAIVSDDPQGTNPARVIGAWTAFEQALGMMHAGRAGEAARALKRLTADHPGSPVFVSTYAQALKEAGDPRAAVAAYRAAVAKWPNDPWLFHDLAVAAREAGLREEAARAEHAALALDSRSAMAQNGLGLLHADAGRSAEAAAAFQRAAELDPTNVSYWTNLGNARRALGDGAGADRAYSQALAFDADVADALNGLGTLYVQAGRAAEAVPLFERALRRDPHLHQARLNLGIALQESGQRDRAAAAYREVLATAPPSARREREAAAALLKGLR